MATSEKTADLDDKELAREIISEMSHSPLLVDIINEVQKHRRFGLPNDKIQQVIINSFQITEAGYEPKSMEDVEIIVTNMPSKYNKLDWT